MAGELGVQVHAEGRQGESSGEGENVGRETAPAGGPPQAKENQASTDDERKEGESSEALPELVTAEDEDEKNGAQAGGSAKHPQLLNTEGDERVLPEPPDARGGSLDLTLGGGAGQYKSEAGSLVSSIERLGRLPTDHWGGQGGLSPLHRASWAESFASRQIVQPQPTSVSLTHSLGRYAVGPDSLAESDPDGFFLRFSLAGQSASGPVTVTFSMSGTARVAMEYTGLPQWELFGANGPLPAALLVDNLDGTYTLTIPPGERAVNLRVPLIDNFTDNPDSEVFYSIQQAGCLVADPGNRTIHILEDTTAEAGGWQHPDSIGPGGPIARLVLTDDLGNHLSTPEATAIRENGGEVHYRLELTDRTDGTPYTAQETITVTLHVEGTTPEMHLFGPDKDFDLDLSGCPAGSSYDPLTGTLILVIEPNGQYVSFTGTPVDDGVDEAMEGVLVNIEAVAGNETTVDPAHRETTVLIGDVPEASITAGAAEYSESGPAMSFTVHLTSALPTPVTIPLLWNKAGTDTATDGLDYSAARPDSVTIPAGQTSYTFTVSITDDHLSEGPGSVSVAVDEQGGVYAPANLYRLSQNASECTASTTIVDDTNFSFAGHENGAKLDGPLVRLVLTDGSGNELSTPDAVSIRENGGEVHYRLELVDRADGVTPYTARENITVSLDVAGSNGLEFTGPGKDFSLDLSACPNGSIYNPGTGELTIVIEQGSRHTDFTGTSAGDNRPEGDETVSVTVAGVDGNESSIAPGHGSATATIVDVPMVSVAVGQPLIYESNAPNALGPGGAALGNTAVFTFTLSSASLDAITVPLDWATGTSATLTSVDYTVWVNGVPQTGLPSSITFPAGTTSYSLTVIATDDRLSELDESLQGTLKHQGGAGSYNASHGYCVDAGAGKSAATTIKDDTSPGAPEANLDGPKVALYVLDKTNTTVQDTRSAAVWEDAPTEQSPGDIPVGAITYRVRLENPDGSAYDGQREEISVTLKLEGLGGANYGNTPGAGDYWLDTAAQIAAANGLAADKVSVIAATCEVTFAIPAAKGYVDLKVNIVADNLTERDRFDYREESDGTITTIPLPDESLKVSLVETSGNESALHDTKTSINTDILEESVSVQVEINAVNAANIKEGQQAEFNIKLSNAAQEAVTVFVRVSSGNPEDLDGRLFTVEIPAGQTAKSFTVPIFNDTYSEGTESYTLEIFDVRGGEAVINPSKYTATGTIVDDMNGPVVGLEAGDHGLSTSEHIGEAGYTVTLNDPAGFPGNHVPSEDMFITLKLDGLTATATGTDADVIWNGIVFDDPRISVDSINGDTIRIKVPAGFEKTAFGLTVKIVDDALSEGTETYTVTITKVEMSEAVIDQNHKSVATEIIDDTAIVSDPQFSGDPNAYLDGPYVWLSGTTVISESAGSAEYRLELRDEFGNTVTAQEDIVITITYTDMAPSTGVDALDPSITDYLYGTAKASQDYTILPTNTTVTIRAGYSFATFSVPIADDSFSESNERFKVEIDKAKGNEARIPADASKNSVVTTIIDDTDWRYDGGPGLDHADGATLDGPIMTLTGTTSIREDEGDAVYQISLDAAPKEPMHVTIRFQGQGGGISPDDVDLAAMRANSMFENVVVDPDDPTSFTFEITVPTGAIAFEFRLPIFNDALTETNECYTLSLVEAHGAEGRIIAGQGDSVTTEIIDDLSGPRLSLSVWDNHTTACPNGEYVEDAYFAHGELDGEPAIVYRISLTAPASEDITVSIRLFNDSGNPIFTRIPPGAAETEPGSGIWVYHDPGTDRDVTFNANTGMYTVIVPGGVDASGNPIGATEAFLKLPTTPTGRYFMEMTSTVMSESAINPDHNLVETWINVASGPPTNPTYIHLIDVDKPGSGLSIDEEGTAAHFRLDLSNANNDYTKTVTPTLQLRFGSGVTFDDFAFADKSGNTWVSNANFTVTDNGARVTGVGKAGTLYEGMTFSYSKGSEMLSFTVSVPVGSMSKEFYIPLFDDSTYEGDEIYTIRGLSGGGSETWFTGTTSHDMIIKDNDTQPTVTLEQTGNAVEGTPFTYTVRLSSAVDDDVTVELKFGKDGDTAKAGQDYAPYVLPVTIPAGQTTATFTISLPDDEYSEGNEKFSVWIERVTSGQAFIGTDTDHPLTTVIEDFISGPNVSLPIPLMSYGEDQQDVLLYVVLDRPAVEDCWITIKVGDNTAQYGTDFTLDGPDIAQLAGHASYTPAELAALTGSFYHYTFNGEHFILAKMIEGQVRAELELKDFLIDNQRTEAARYMSFTIVKTQGGEVQIPSGTESATLTIEDVPNGPFVLVEADKTTLLEAAGVDPANPDIPAGADATVTYTFKLENNLTAEQQITITYVIERVSGRCDGIPIGQGTIVIEAGQRASDPLIIASLLNDKIDERSPEDRFRLRIVAVEGNEAQIHADAATGVTVSITDDDHAPTPLPDSVILMLPSQPQSGSFSFDALANDSDADGDPLSAILKDAGGTYGSYHIGADGTVTYTLDPTKQSVKNMTAGQTYGEQNFVYKVTDGANPVDSTLSLTLKIGNSATGTAGAERIFGTDGNDTISGGGGADIIHGRGGDDILIDVDGRAILYGDEGDDTFVVNDLDNDGWIKPADFSELHGGTGTDVIRVNGTGKTLSFTQSDWGAAVLDGIEVLDISGGASAGNTLRIDSFAVAKLEAGRDDAHPPRVTGNAGDCIEFTGGNWQCADPTAVEIIDGKTFYRFSDGTNELLVQNTIAQIMRGTAGNDNVTLPDRPVIYYGDGGDDAIVGGSVDSKLYGGDGNDILDAGTGKHLLDGGSGDDTLILRDINNDGLINWKDFAGLHGGSGTDTLQVGGSGLTLDLSSGNAADVSGMERIDISGGNSLKLSGDMLAAMATELAPGQPLVVTGSPGDTFELAGAGWTFNGRVTDGDGTWNTYTNNGKTLYVDAAVARVVQGTTGNDTMNYGEQGAVIHGGEGSDILHNGALGQILYGDAGNDEFRLSDLTGDTIIDWSDFAGLHGGSGTDTLKVNGTGLTLDLSSGNAANISGIERIDIAGGNNLRLSGDMFAAMASELAAGQPLIVTGGAGGGFELTGAGWTFTGRVTDGSGTWNAYAYGGKTLYVDAALTRSVQGTAGDDTLISGEQGAVVHGGDGNDILYNGALGQTLYGDGGNDTFLLSDLSGDSRISADDFTAIHGGAGTNTIEIFGLGDILDLSGLTSGIINDVEAISLSGAGSRLILDQDSLTALGQSAAMTVNGAGAGVVELWGGQWAYESSQSGNSVYHDASGRTVAVDESMRVELHGGDNGEQLVGGLENTGIYGGAGNDVLDGGQGGVNLLSGGAGDDLFLLRDTGSDGIITMADYSGLHGGDGTDTLQIQGAGLILDLTAFSPAGISGFEIIDLGAGNSLKINAEAFAQAASGNTLMVAGGAGASVEVTDLLGEWLPGAVQDIGGVNYVEYTTTYHNSETLTLLVQQDILTITGI